MVTKNDMTVGVLIGVVFPAMAWFINGYLFKNQLLMMHKPGVPYLLAITLNLLLMRYCYKRGADLTGNGIILSTFAFMLVVFVFKMVPIR